MVGSLIKTLTVHYMVGSLV